MTERFVVGLVGAPFGLKGFVKVRSLSGEYEHLQRLSSVILRQEGDKESRWEIEETALVTQSLVMKLKGIDSLESAKVLNGAEMLVTRAYAAPLKTDEFYIEDLKGLKVIIESGERREIVGCIISIVEGGGGSLAEVRLRSGQVRLVPFRNEFFGAIRLEAGEAVLLEPWILE
jgi:16S rRNA processing protein RimM